MTPTVPAAGSQAVLHVLAPFPIIRIRGRLVHRGAVVTLFTVTAPRQARIWVRCAGAGCPRRSYAVYARGSRTRIRRFEGFLRGGTRLTVSISRPGFVGKFSSFRIRAGQPPVRHDQCLAAVGRTPTACPAPAG